MKTAKTVFRIASGCTALAVALLSTGFPAHAAAAEATVVVEVPASHPPGVTAPLAGTLKAGGESIRQWKLTRAGQPGLIAQRESGTDRIWIITRFAEQDRRKRVRYRAVALESDGKKPGFSEKAGLLKNRMRIVPDDNGCWFYNGERKLFYYRKSPKSHEGTHTRAGYVHPLFGMNGEPITEEFPPDHRHHHGVFWAWHQLLVGDLRAGDPWITKDFLAVVRKTEVLDEGPLFARFRATVDWTSPLYTDESGKPQPIIEEQTEIRAFRPADGKQWIDFAISLRALVPDVKIGGAENARGYSGFTVRVRPPEDQRIIDENGLLSEDAVGTKSRWADVSGTFAGAGDVSGIAILSHRSLPQFPPKWLLRHYGMQNVVYPGRHPLAVSQENPLVLRHRLLLHRGNFKSADVQAQQRIYEQTP